MRCLLSKWKLKSAYLHVILAESLMFKNFQIFFSAESIDFLSLQHNEHGWGCRWEWVSKHLAAKAARNNVTFLTRTRILSHQHTGEHHLLHLSHNERDFPHRLEVDHVVSMSKNALIGPGQRRHTIDLNDIQHYPFPPSRSWFGGTLPTSSLPTSIRSGSCSLTQRRINRMLVVQIADLAPPRWIH